MESEKWTGKRFGKLIITKEPFKNLLDKHKHKWCEVICDCGIIKLVRLANLTIKNSTTISCGCFRDSNSYRKIKHGYGKSGAKDKYLYTLYHNINQRCNNPEFRDYQMWGGRGIEFHFYDFISFKDYILINLGHRPSELYSLDRIHTNKHYEPGNLRWATQGEQMRNTRRQNKYTGIYWDKINNKWKVQMNNTTIGRFKDKEEARLFREKEWTKLYGEKPKQYDVT